MEFVTLIGLVFVCYVLFYLVFLAFSDSDVTLWFYSKFGKKLDHFRNKVVWITGASSGIGEYISLELAKHGAKLVLSARNSLELERVRDRCLDGGAGRDDVLVLPLDVTDFHRHEECFLRVIQHFGKLDILLNNAGRSQRASWEDIELSVDKDMFEVNVFGVVSLSRIAVRYFEKSGGGHIAVMSSLAGLFGAPYSATYTATKHALHGYFKSLRTEKLDSSVSITLLCPGPVVSNILSQSFTDKHGEVYGHESSNDKRMETERCAHLSAVALANQLSEAWIASFPIIPLTYILVYFPNVASRITALIGAKNLQKMRDNKKLLKRAPVAEETSIGSNS